MEIASKGCTSAKCWVSPGLKLGGGLGRHVPQRCFSGGTPGYVNVILSLPWVTECPAFPLGATAVVCASKLPTLQEERQHIAWVI